MELLNNFNGSRRGHGEVLSSPLSSASCPGGWLVQGGRAELFQFSPRKRLGGS